MVEWHHRLNGHEFEQALGDGEGKGSLVFCSPWGLKESDMPEQLNNNRGAGSSRQAIKYDDNNKSNEKACQRKHFHMESELASSCNS